MTIKASKAPTAVENEWCRQVSFDFGKGKGGMKEPEGFGDLTVDQEVTVIVKGKVNSIRVDSDSSSFSLVMDEIKLEAGKKGGISEALAAAKKKLKVA